MTHSVTHPTFICLHLEHLSILTQPHSLSQRPHGQQAVNKPRGQADPGTDPSTTPRHGRHWTAPLGGQWVPNEQGLRNPNVTRSAKG